MQKPQADKAILSYVKKIYGFALSKTKNLEQAEELSARITYEVYKTLLKKDDIYSLDSYIYRTSCNIYALFLKEMKEEQPALPEEDLAAPEDTSFSEMNERLYNEIAYLSSLQRKIVILHYFHKQNLKSIAANLNIPLGTVKWHLIEARHQMKEGFSAGEKRLFDPSQKRFLEMCNHGYLGMYKIDMSAHFSKSLSQYVAYSAYYKGKTAGEIAKDLAIPTYYIEDELEQLTENGYMTKISADKYLTDVYIEEENPEIDSKIDNLMTRYAREVCEQYMPDFLKSCENLVVENENTRDKIHIPDNDLNFFLYSAIGLLSGDKLRVKYNQNIEDFYVKRKDGGLNIATSKVGFDTSKDLNNFELNRDLTDHTIYSINRDIYPFEVWQLTSHLDTRIKQGKYWEMMLFEDYFDFFYKRPAQLTANLNDINTYIRLLEKGLIKVGVGSCELGVGSFELGVQLPTPHSQLPTPNMIVIEMKDKELASLLPKCPEKLLNKGKKLDEEIYKICKPIIPPHHHNLCRVMTQNTLSSPKMRVMIIDYLLKTKVLKPLKKEQKATVNMVMQAEKL